MKRYADFGQSIVVQLRVYWQAENSGHEFFCCWQAFAAHQAILISGLLVNRPWVMDGRPDIPLGQKIAQGVPSIALDDVLVIYVV